MLCKKKEKNNLSRGKNPSPLDIKWSVPYQSLQCSQPWVGTLYCLISNFSLEQRVNGSDTSIRWQCLFSNKLRSKNKNKQMYDKTFVSYSERNLL